MPNSTHQRKLMRGAVTLLSGMVILLICVYLVLGLVMTFAPSWGPTKEEAKTAIENLGYQDVQNIEKHWFGSQLMYGCSEEDSFAYPFTTLNAEGKRISLVGCSGLLFKGVTVRAPANFKKPLPKPPN